MHVINHQPSRREGGEKNTQREGGTEGEENCFFFFRLARERGWREGERQIHRERGTEGEGEREGEGGRRNLFFLLLPHERERVAGGRAGGGERERDEEGTRRGERERGRDGPRGGERQEHREREGRREREGVTNREEERERGREGGREEGERESKGLTDI